MKSFLNWLSTEVAPGAPMVRLEYVTPMDLKKRGNPYAERAWRLSTVVAQTGVNYQRSKRRLDDHQFISQGLQDWIEWLPGFEGRVLRHKSNGTLYLRYHRSIYNGFNSKPFLSDPFEWVADESIFNPWLKASQKEGNVICRNVKLENIISVDYGSSHFEGIELNARFGS